MIQPKPTNLLDELRRTARRVWLRFIATRGDEEDAERALFRAARTAVFAGRAEEALEIAAHPRVGQRTLGFLMESFFYARRFEEAFAIGERWFAKTGAGLVAFNLACTLAQLDRQDEAIEWLARSAAKGGWLSLQRLDEDPDLAPLRKRPEFHQIRARIASLGRTAL